MSHDILAGIETIPVAQCFMLLKRRSMNHSSCLHRRRSFITNDTSVMHKVGRSDEGHGEDNRSHGVFEITVLTVIIEASHKVLTRSR